MGSYNQAHLLGGDVAGCFLKFKHLKNKVNVIFKIFYLGALARINDIFQGQRVNVEMGAHFLNQIDLMKPVDIDPADRRLVFIGKRFFNAL